MSLVRIDALHFWPGGGPRAALDGISLTLEPGEVVLLDGPSGGGKSTLLRAMAGLVPHFHGGRFSGKVTVQGFDTRTVRPGELATVVGCVFQDPESQAVRTTVARDVAFGPENRGCSPDEIARRVQSALAQVGASHLADRTIDALSGGERQRVAIAGVLALEPRLLLLDEPTSQLDDRGVAMLCDVVTRLAANGTTVVVAEHHRERLVGIAGRTLHLVDGRLADAPHEPYHDTPARSTGADVLELDGVSAHHGTRQILTDVSLRLASGSITALHGGNGTGKSTLARIIAGLHAPTAGTVRLDGRDITEVATEDRHPALVLMPQDAGRWLLRDRVDAELGSAASHLPAGARASAVAGVMVELEITPLAARHPLDLSVGERERVALGCALVSGARVLVLDEPSRGMDPHRRALLSQALDRRAREGSAALVITHDAAFAHQVADQHVEVVEGRVVQHVGRVRR